MPDNAQPSILPGVTRSARYLSFNTRPGVETAAVLEALNKLPIDDRLVVGIGEPLIAHCKASVPGLRTFPALTGPGVHVPSTQHDLWCWLRGDDTGDVVNQSIVIVDTLANVMQLDETVDAFKHGSEELGRDLTGYEDGTENPTGDEAVETAFVASDDAALAGSSFVAVQRWVHDLRTFGHMSADEQDLVIGRRKSDNTEIEDAPESAHVKRTEQESFSPEAHVLRRSMPFAGADGEGLNFVAFGHSLDAFEVQLRRMVGEEDGITDALFSFSRAVSGGYYWCPPVAGGKLNLGALAA
ncbi:MAG: Dyp-type peroxidase [Halieaceae bacterium]|nr:Dyp-type peroxidase [Halieaceae bacterium]